ncbi:hypothetical protein H5410_023444 [Solanum commersonii]|uniref:Uncharacterized protein n=1 Tax=Solanum commersonii TaxID=4109 RepID=A0A9J5ZGW4_SOLCO|nr:hypothetical protein H5410_023444 [Solanum commersonii]
MGILARIPHIAYSILNGATWSMRIHIADPNLLVIESQFGTGWTLCLSLLFHFSGEPLEVGSAASLGVTFVATMIDLF